MRVSYVEGIASRNGPESCGVARKGGVEALTGERTGRVLSREIHALPRKRQVLREADAVGKGGRQHRAHRSGKVCQASARSETPSTHGSTLRGNREIPTLPRPASDLGRIGKSEDVRR